MLVNRLRAQEVILVELNPNLQTPVGKTVGKIALLSQSQWVQFPTLTEKKGKP